MTLVTRVAIAICTSAIVSAQAFVNFENAPVTPMRISPDGSRLFVADTVGDHLCVFDLSRPERPFLIAEIPVGLDPVSVNPRNRDEVWVTCLLSDTVCIVDVPARRVVETLRVVDEPSDVVFAGGKAFVTAATVDEVRVFDATTRAPLGSLEVFGKDPRALVVSADGSRVYAVVQRSGNGTTVLPHGASPPPIPTNPLLPPAPVQALIVRADDPAWAAQIDFTLPDNDVAEIDVATLAVTRYFPGVGTTNTGIAVHPTTGDLWVANTEARNLVRFEPNLRGHAIDSRLTRITTGVVPTVVPFDLNDGLDYLMLPNPTALASALSEPFGVAIDGTANLVYVAAHGSDRIGIVDMNGVVVDRIEIGGTPGAIVDTRKKRGPRALLLHPSDDLLYVFNRLSDTLSIVDTTTRTVLREHAVATVDPMPQSMREGRKFLYDAKLSGNGTMSCAACHIDGDVDGLAWDLGDPGGIMVPPPQQPPPFMNGLVDFHPLKGPTQTQTLRGLEVGEVMHWRGDRPSFQSFNGAFDSLMGGALIAGLDMMDFAAFGTSIALPPNPNQRLDRTLRTSPAANNEANGLAEFLRPGSIGVRCSDCHALPTGSNKMVMSAAAIVVPQQMKVAHLRTLYRKVGFDRGPGQSKSGFGFMHDGAIGTMTEFLGQPVFRTGWIGHEMDDLETYLLSFDSGTAPLLGYQFVLNSATVGTAPFASDLAMALTAAAAGDLDLTAHGLVDGNMVGLHYDPVADDFDADRATLTAITVVELESKAALATADLVFTAVPAGSGNRMAIDRDLDGVRNSEQAAVTYGQPTPGCAGDSTLIANSDARVGNGLHGYVMENAPANSLSVIKLGVAPTPGLPYLGIALYVLPIATVVERSDALGEAQHRLPIPDNPGLIGASIYAQSLWLDFCGSNLFSSSAGLRFTIM